MIFCGLTSEASAPSAPTSASSAATEFSPHEVMRCTSQPFGPQSARLRYVVDRMLTDDVHDARMRLLGVVKVGEAAGQTGAKMKRSRCEGARHLVVTVSRSGHDSLEQTQPASHPVDAIRRGGPGSGEADIDTARHQGPHKTFRTVHY